MSTAKWFVIGYWIFMILLAISAIYLMIKGIQGWEWILVVMVLLGGGFSYSDKSDEKDEDKKIIP